jgi:hypothetical protein
MNALASVPLAMSFVAPHPAFAPLLLLVGVPIVVAVVLSLLVFLVCGDTPLVADLDDETAEMTQEERERYDNIMREAEAVAGLRSVADDEFRGYYVDHEHFIPFDPEARRARNGIGGSRDARV